MSAAWGVAQCQLQGIRQICQLLGAWQKCRQLGAQYKCQLDRFSCMQGPTCMGLSVYVCMCLPAWAYLCTCACAYLHGPICVRVHVHTCACVFDLELVALTSLPTLRSLELVRDCPALLTCPRVLPEDCCEANRRALDFGPGCQSCNAFLGFPY